MIIKGNKIYFEDGVLSGYLKVEDGIIKQFLPIETEIKADVDYHDNLIIPGIFDTHNHGTMGYSLMHNDETDVKAQVRGYLKGVAAQGVTNVLPTADYRIIKEVAEVAQEELMGARVIGIHSEGPYLNRVGEKGIYKGFPDIDMNVVRKMYEDSQGMLKLVAIAPEIPRSQEVVDYLASKGVRTAFAHSDCNFKEANEAFAKGITVSTHTANVMSGIHHRNMGGLGACLLNDNVECEVICDCLHVSEEMLEIMFRVKNYDKFMMISDSTPTSGAPEGKYSFGSFGAVNVTPEGFCLTETGRLAGSTKPVIYGIKCLYERLNIPLETIIKMASLNPSKVYGVSDRKGSIKVDKDADLVVIDPAFNVLATYVEGTKVFDVRDNENLFNPEYLKKYKIA